MRLMDLLSEDVITTSLQSTTRDGVIAELVDLLVQRSVLAESARAGVLEAVNAREASQSTGLGAGVAIPHGLSPEVEDVVAAMGIHHGGVDFASIDGQPVRIVILLVVPPNMFQAHVRTLAGIARVLNDANLRDMLLAAREAETVLEVLIDREEAACH